MGFINQRSHHWGPHIFLFCEATSPRRSSPTVAAEVIAPSSRALWLQWAALSYADGAVGAGWDGWLFVGPLDRKRLEESGESAPDLQ